ncbi:pyridoxamine 5'-phosphate oxidase family protein [Marinobacterium lutimaris]|uniref:Nitroimidazol reductase NimA, pyridoxamine 5'-phosphate oxidase superfamily n=1 Tax=Marinobacterium lutimaris TaxID=568106 RepID=A0A1H6DVX3_9GAMM|nr:pyridoxamine 5'-phosphate oxidase family protein [Marinobacterium lutimaris]SEG88883.1 hypothetical protein SAMN05444390_11044 [Marinobacterium lutimaris]
MSDFQITDNTRVRRRPERAHYDRDLVNSIIDEALVCNVAFVSDGLPRIIPTSIVRIENDIYLHGSPNNRMLTALADGVNACISVAHIDAIVMGRSGMGCSVDYRSVVIFGNAEVVTESEHKAKVLYSVIDSTLPGHKVRELKESELAATLVLKFPLKEVSAKVRDIGVKDIEADYELDAWAGVIPLKTVPGQVQDCPRIKPGIVTPAYALNYPGPSGK